VGRQRDAKSTRASAAAPCKIRPAHDKVADAMAAESTLFAASQSRLSIISVCSLGKAIENLGLTCLKDAPTALSTFGMFLYELGDRRIWCSTPTAR
jgi:hypothetical protein